MLKIVEIQGNSGGGGELLYNSPLSSKKGGKM